MAVDIDIVGQLGAADVAGGQLLLEVVHRLAGEGLVILQVQPGQQGKIFQVVHVLIGKAGAAEAQHLQAFHLPQAGKVPDGVIVQIQLLQAVHHAERGGAVDGVAGSVHKGEAGNAHEGAQVRDLVAGNIQPLQQGQVHQRAEIADLVIGQIQLHQLLAGGEGGNIPQAHAAEVQLGHVGLEGDAAEADVLILVLRGVGMDGAVGQGLGKGLQLGGADIDAFQAKAGQVGQAAQGAEVRNRVVVQIQGTQAGQGSQGHQVLNVVVTEIQGH